ncbi:MAG: NapC/NirT family cytochrome c [Proteobacteria bacterium]|nr:NapC/NirT family cytochrome c [Cystobacterineae bacterium]MCL2258241.1 NapC/NirT family cytochrome c [Cystobacterineae bacterium]MCL2315402.1 NapC/NirT family cytochrome c [Pseudomonadota bacterium]
MTTLILILGVGLSLVGLLICMRLWLLPASKLNAKAGAAGVKLTAAVGFVVLPLLAVGVANYQTFEGVKEVSSCAGCHVMAPMVNDMLRKDSTSLAARHFNNRWIAEKQCYNCHSDYGLSGTIKSKGDGFRHLARYVTGSYKEPIEYHRSGGFYDNNNCLKCHAVTEKFQAVSSHGTLRANLSSSQTSCLNCHGPAHPTALQRTPGSKTYEALTHPPLLEASR